MTLQFDCTRLVTGVPFGFGVKSDGKADARAEPRIARSGPPSLSLLGPLQGR